MRPCDVVDELGLDRNTLYARLHDARNGKLPEAGSAREVTAEQAKISRLYAELARSRRECVLLKKSRRASARPASCEVRLNDLVRDNLRRLLERGAGRFQSSKTGHMPVPASSRRRAHSSSATS